LQHNFLWDRPRTCITLYCKTIRALASNINIKICTTMSPDLPWIDDGHCPVDGSTPVKLEVDFAGPARSLTRLDILVVQLCPFFGGSVLIGADRWFRCSGRGWIDVVCAVVERRWSGGWVVRYWSATLVRWVLLLRSAVGWGWGRPESEREMKTKIKEND
jgi:hypothetical protein